MKRIFTNKNLREMLLINFLIGVTEATFAFRATFLAGYGATATQIGLVFSAMSVISMISPIIGGILADKILSRYQVFIIGLFCTAAIIGFLPLSATIRIGSIIAAMLLMPMIQLFRPVSMAMLATCTINAVAYERNVDYSQIRLWMSVGYTLASLLFTPIVHYFGIDSIYYCSLVCFALVLLFRKTMKSNETEESAARRMGLDIKPTAAAERKKNARVGEILKNYYIVTFVVLNIIYASAGNCSSYLSYILEANNIDTAQVGVVAGLKVVGEVTVMLLLPQLKKKLSMSGLQVLAGVFLVLELFIMQFARVLPLVIFAEMFGGVGNGIYLSCAGLYVRKMAPKGLEATAQSVSGIGSCLGGIILAALYGRIIETSGVYANYRLAIVLQLIWIALFIGTLVFGEKVLKKKNVCSILFLKKGERAV